MLLVDLKATGGLHGLHQTQQCTDPFKTGLTLLLLCRSVLNRMYIDLLGTDLLRVDKAYKAAELLKIIWRRDYISYIFMIIIILLVI